jgi:hypothetical protein
LNSKEGLERWSTWGSLLSWYYLLVFELVLDGIAEIFNATIALAHKLECLSCFPVNVYYLRVRNICETPGNVFGHILEAGELADTAAYMS